MRFNRVFIDGETSKVNTTPRYHRARVIEVFFNDNPLLGESLIIRANLINERKEQQISANKDLFTETDVREDPLEFLLTQIKVILKPGTDTPSVGDEILVLLISNEETRILNIDGYCERITKTYSFKKMLINGITSSIFDLKKGLNSFFNPLSPAEFPNTDQIPEVSSDKKELLRQAKKANKDLNSLTTEAKQKVELLLERIEQEGIPIKLFETKRTQLRQKYLYSKSRTTEQLRAVGITEFEGLPNEPRATSTLDSNHKNGEAIDVILDLNHPYWNGKTKPNGPWDTSPEFLHIWQKYRKLAHEVGLYTISWDKPHASTRRG